MKVEASFPSDGQALDHSQGLGDVIDVGSGGDDLERGTSAVADHVALAARLPAVDRRRAGGAVGGIHAGSRPVQLVGRGQFSEQAVRLVEDIGLVPPAQPTPAGLTGTEPVQDALQAQLVVHRPWAGRLLRPRRQQRIDQHPQVVIHDPRPAPHTSLTAESPALVTVGNGVRVRLRRWRAGTHSTEPQPAQRPPRPLPASASVTRSSASLPSVRVPTRSRFLTSVLDRQRKQLLAGRADLDVGVHLRAGSDAHSRHAHG